MAYVEQVFTLSGVPTYTFVEPNRYHDILVSIRTAGRCLVLEGPSGIGKSTTVEKVIEGLGLHKNVLLLTPRKPGDVDIIRELPRMNDIGTVIVDDFHKLPNDVKESLSDYMKVLSDTESKTSKLILIGINKAGQQLVKYANDLGLRIDVVKLEANPDAKILELISLGEAALNIEIEDKDKIAERAQGSFQIAQLLCHKLCTLNRITETLPEKKKVKMAIDVVVEDVMVDLDRQFKEAAVTFARGSKIRPEGRAPYLHMLRWLANGEEWSLDLSEATNIYTEHKQSIGQVIDKGYLSALLNDPEKEPILGPHFHFEPSTSILSVEDPKFIFYLKNLVWRAFTRQVGFKAEYFGGRYDFALSFAGANRDHAKRLKEILDEREVSCFYDEDEQHRIIAANVEEYLAPIYRSEARYVIAFLSPDYPTRIWTKFESDAFRDRFGQNAVIPLRYTTSTPNFFSDEQKYGGLAFDPMGDVEAQLQAIAEVLCRRLIEDRKAGRRAEEGETAGATLAIEPA